MAGTKIAKPIGPKTPIERAVGPIQRFMQVESSGGILLIASALVALIWANVPGLSDSYFQAFKETYFSIGPKGAELTKPVYWWINDLLMAVFFLLVGLEIKREVLSGELSSFKKASLPIAAAIGGMLVPALLYFFLNQSGPQSKGWGIPMATDIAFALGLLALLGKRVPIGLKVFLTALAIIDDIGAVLVIAIFYTPDLQAVQLLYCGLAWGAMVVMNMLGVRRLTPYAFPAALVWYFMLQSGVHATLAGILAAFAIPCRPRLDLGDFTERMDHLVETVKQGARSGAFFEMAVRIKQVESPLERLERWLHPWVAFFIVPVFALANAGVKLGGDTGGAAGGTVIMGIALGLIVGKLVGIFGFSFLAVKLGFGALPQGVNWTKIAGAASLAGIGFTMSLFIGGLAFKQAPELIDAAKIGILAASGVSAVVGMTFLFIATRDTAKQAKEE